MKPGVVFSEINNYINWYSIEDCLWMKLSRYKLAIILLYFVTVSLYRSDSEKKPSRIEKQRA